MEVLTYTYPKVLLAAALLPTGPSCKNLLDEQVVSQGGAAYITTPAGYEMAVYALLRDFYGRESGMTITVFGTDTYTMGSDGSFKFVGLYTPQLDGRT